MTRKVEGERLYHINRQLPYSQQHALMQAGQRIAIGDDFNPFYGFFRAERTYPVVRDGTEVRYGPLIYLKKLSDGGVTHDGNALREAHSIATHYSLLARELVWEFVRRTDFGEAPSRWRGLWVCSERDVSMWVDRLGEPANCPSQIVEVAATGRVHECDASLLAVDHHTIDAMTDSARLYWSGQTAANAREQEILFEGELAVLRTFTPDEWRAR